MPTYEYACRACGEHLEVVQSFKDAALTECGRCGGDLRKVFSAAGIIFKGSGYYVTDSRKSKSATVGAGGSSDSSGADSSGNGAKSTPAKKDASSDTSSSSSTSSDSANSA